MACNVRWVRLKPAETNTRAQAGWTPPSRLTDSHVPSVHEFGNVMCSSGPLSGLRSVASEWPVIQCANVYSFQGT